MKRNLMAGIFEESRKSKKIIGIRKYDEDDEFFCGYVVDFNDELLIIQHFTKLGKPDGLVIEKIENIESIDSDDAYSRCYQYLVDNHQKIDRQPPVALALTDTEHWQVDLIRQLKDTDAVIELEINKDILVAGKVTELDDQFIQIRTIGKLGEDEGNTLHRLADITSVRYDRMEDRKRKLLYDWRKEAGGTF